jgi:hypothetical protein
MAGVVGGVVGGTIGFIVGGPVGAQIGWQIGAQIGNSFTTIKQPRIGELAEIRAGEGGPRARVYGTFRPIGGQVVWSGAPREIRRRQRQGKGGPKVESSTILRSYAIGICEGPIIGVRRIWRNNELVYDVRPGSEMLDESAKWIEGKAILTGAWDQMPHPTIEAEAGATNAPAMRGTACLVITDEDLTDLRGAIPAYQFEVGGSGASFVRPADLPSGGTVVANVAGGLGLPGTTFFDDEEPNVVVSGSLLMRARIVGGRAAFTLEVDGLIRDSLILEAAVGAEQSAILWSSVLGGESIIVRYTTIENFDLTIGSGSVGQITAKNYALTPAELGLPSSAASAEVFAGLSEIVREVCGAARIPLDRVDVSRLPPIAVPGFATSPDYTAAAALQELSKIYFFDPQDADGRIRFIPRGGDFRAILTEDEFVDGENEPEADTTRDSISVPRLLHLSYFDVNGGQGTDKQFSERQISPRTEAPTVLSTPVVLEAETAAKSLRIQHQVMEEELRGDLVFGVSDKHIGLTEADTIVAQYRGRSQRARITKVVMNDGWQQLTCLRDRQSAYNANPQAVPPAVVTRPPSTIVGATRFAFLDIPALTQAGDLLGYHIATSGEVAGWRGAAVERQEGSEFGLLATDGGGTVMGTLTAALPLASEWYPDETNTLAVQLARSDDELEAIDTATWLARGNAAAIVRADGTAEIVQFRNAVETSPGVWALSGLQRGRLNSGASAHAIGATFVLLDGALFVQTGSERLASTLTHRAYSVGNLPSSATAQARTWTGRSQREWPPIIETAARVADTVTVTWTPRHRFGSDESPVASSHFDGWQVDATSGGTTRTATVLTPTASIDVTGLTNPITVTVRGRNRLAGLGDPATRIIP